MTPETSPQTPPPNGKFGPFSAAWLYPKEWDLSDLQGEQSPDSDEGRAWMDGSNRAELTDEQQAASRAQRMPDSYEPFHEVHTLPSGWDLS
jgi:hypothetical protein